MARAIGVNGDRALSVERICGRTFELIDGNPLVGFGGALLFVTLPDAAIHTACPSPDIRAARRNRAPPGWA